MLGPTQPVTLERTIRTDVPVEQAINRQRMRPGSGTLCIRVSTDGPTRVLQVMDINKNGVRFWARDAILCISALTSVSIVIWIFLTIEYHFSAALCQTRWPPVDINQWKTKTATYHWWGYRRATPKARPTWSTNSIHSQERHWIQSDMSRTLRRNHFSLHE